MSEKFCLKWNDFHSNVSKSFGMFRNEDYLHDVTLVSDDHHQVSAHKLVLSACSEYFKDIFKQIGKPNAHPLLCLDGILSEDLKNIMDYIYNGEVKIFQEHLDRFLSVAQRLKLQGLIGNEDQDSNDFGEDKISSHKEEAVEAQSGMEYNPSEIINNVKNNVPKKKKEIAMADQVLVPLNSDNISEVDTTVNQYIEKSDDGNAKCTLCGKVDASRNKWQNLRNHIETHLEGLSFPCQLCGKTFRSRNAFNIHKTRYHK